MIGLCLQWCSSLALIVDLIMIIIIIIIIITIIIIIIIIIVITIVFKDANRDFSQSPHCAAN